MFRHRWLKNIYKYSADVIIVKRGGNEGMYKESRCTTSKATSSYAATVCSTFLLRHLSAMKYAFNMKYVAFECIVDMTVPIAHAQF